MGRGAGVKHHGTDRYSARGCTCSAAPSSAIRHFVRSPLAVGWIARRGIQNISLVFRVSVVVVSWLRYEGAVLNIDAACEA